MPVVLSRPLRNGVISRGVNGGLVVGRLVVLLAAPESVDDSYDAAKKYAEHRDQPTLNNATPTLARSTT